MKMEEAKIKALKRGFNIDGHVQIRFDGKGKAMCMRCGNVLTKFYMVSRGFPIMGGNISCGCSIHKVPKKYLA